MSKYLDKYVEYETIGRGSYGNSTLILGSAHLVRSKSDQSVYVAKKIQLFSLKQKEQEDSKREVTLLQKLRHPHIVQYIESFNENDTLIIIMEYCEGRIKYMPRGMNQRKEYFPEPVILNWFLQCALALKYIHEQKILHRDIKSQNLFLSSNGFVKIGDFGISRVLEHTADQANTVVGTPYYMRQYFKYFSPEVCENKPYTYKSDVWSLGCVLYELCTLQHAFKSNNLLGLVNRIVREQANAIPKHYSKELADLINKLLIKSADQRPQTYEIFNFPIIRNVMQEFIAMQGKVQINIPIKRTNTHNQIEKMIKQEETSKQATQQTYNAYDNTIDTVQSIDLSQLTPAQRLKLKKEEEVQRKQRELEQAARANLSQNQEASQRKRNDLQGGQVSDYNQKRKQQQQYHDQLQKQQQQYGKQSEVEQIYQSLQKKNQPQQNQSSALGYDVTLVSQYEQTSKMVFFHLHQIQNNSKFNESFKKELEAFDKTVDSEMCQSTFEQQTRKSPEQTVTKSQLDRFTTQKNELSVTQQYQDEEFEEYNSDEEDHNEINHRLTVKGGDSEIDEVVKLYKIQIDQTLKKQPSNKLEEINETSQESWTSSQSSPQKIPRTNQERIQQLKKQAISKLGSDLYNKAYQFLGHHISKGTPTNEVQIPKYQVRATLEEMVGKSRMADCMLIDQILYYENF